jgi:hypothetical protein
MRAVIPLFALLLAGCVTRSRAPVRVAPTKPSRAELAAPTMPVAERAEASVSPHTLPDGWVATSVDSPQDAPVGKLSRQALLDALSPQRPLVAPQELSLAALPHVETRPVSSSMPARVMDLPIADDVLVDLGAKTRAELNARFEIGALVGPRSVRLGTFQLSFLWGAVNSRGSAIGASCGGTGNSRLSELKWSKLERTSEGVIYSRAHGWFDHTACRAHVDARFSSVAAPIVEGKLYGFVLREKGETSDATTVQLIAPDTQGDLGTMFAGELDSAFVLRSVAIHVGNATSTEISARVAPSRGASWERTRFEVHVSQAVGEDAPSAILLASAPSPAT